MAQAAVGAVIRGARAQAGLTQRELGALCGYSASAVSRLESGASRPEWATVLRIARVLRIPLDRLSMDPPAVACARAACGVCCRASACGP